MSNLTNNTTELQAVLEILQDKVTGTVLPELTNEATAADLAVGKQLIDSHGNIVIGTNPYEKEETEAIVEEQADLIGEIEEAVDNLPNDSEGGESTPVEIVLQDKTVTENGTYTADDGYDGLGTVTVEVSGGESGGNVSADWIAKVTAIIERTDTNLIFPSGFTQLGEHFFHGCNNLVSCIIEPGITTIGTSTFYGCTKLTTLIIPNTVTTIKGYLCYGCTSLSSIELPDSVTNLGASAFRGCTVLTNVKLPSNLTSLDNYTFNGCTSLTHVKIPSSVTDVGTQSFYNCTALQEVDFSELTAVPKLSNKNAFTNVPTTCVIKVPTALYNDWIAATNWSTYANMIVAA
jgi:hypothetical protein